MTKNNETYNVDVHLGDRSCPIHIHDGALEKTGQYVSNALYGKSEANGQSAIIITNPRIGSIYGDQITNSLNNAGFKCLPILSISPGERFKNLSTVERLYGHMYDEKVDRRSVVIALGGGVVGDVAGFLASSYLRGLDFIQIPTTLLAQVDSSVGGKVGVNFKRAKNSIGAFYQPKAVIIDPCTLKSLPGRERLSGLAEVIKYGVIEDAEMFSRIKSETKKILDLSSNSVGYAIARSCEIKAKVVESDEHETNGLRAKLNFGHTIGHALEAETNYKRYSHGEAIAIGMLSGCLIGEAVGITSRKTTLDVATALELAGFKLHIEQERNIDVLLSLLTLDKKSIGGQARFVLLHEIGKSSSGHVVQLEVVRQVLIEQRDWLPVRTSAVK